MTAGGACQGAATRTNLRTRHKVHRSDPVIRLARCLALDQQVRSKHCYSAASNANAYQLAHLGTCTSMPRTHLLVLTTRRRVGNQGDCDNGPKSDYQTLLLHQELVKCVTMHTLVTMALLSADRTSCRATFLADPTPLRHSWLGALEQVREGKKTADV